MLSKSSVVMAVLVGLNLITANLAFSSNPTGVAMQKIAYEQLVKSCIEGSYAKTAFRYSSSKNLQQRAALEFIKAAFIERYKNELILEMIEKQIDTKPYQVQRYLNQRFYEIVRQN